MSSNQKKNGVVKIVFKFENSQLVSIKKTLVGVR